MKQIINLHLDIYIRYLFLLKFLIFNFKQKTNYYLKYFSPNSSIKKNFPRKSFRDENLGTSFLQASIRSTSQDEPMKNENESLVFARWGEGGSTTWACLQRQRIPRDWAQCFGRDSFRIKVEGPFRISGYSISYAIEEEKRNFTRSLILFSFHGKLLRVFRLS